MVRLSIFDCRAEILHAQGPGNFSLSEFDKSMKDKLVALHNRNWDEDWEKQCQVLLKINCGIDWADFGDLLILKRDHLGTRQHHDLKKSMLETVMGFGKTYLAFSVQELSAVREDFAKDMFVRMYLIPRGLYEDE